MSECSRPTMKDLLPDLVHERLTVVQRVEVRAHVDGCASCRADLVVLERVQVALAASRLAVDVSRIVAVVKPYRPTPAWRRLASAPALRAAAAIVVLLGGATVWQSMTRARTDAARGESGAPAIGEPTMPVATVAVGASTASAPRASRGGPAELAVGEAMHDLSDSDLRALLQALGTLDAVTPAESEIVVPAVGGGRSGT